MVTIGWAVGLIFQAMTSALGWFTGILNSIDGATGFFLACFTVFVTSGVLLKRLRGGSIMNDDEQKEDES